MYRAIKLKGYYIAALLILTAGLIITIKTVSGERAARETIATKNEQKGVFLPIIMYHAICPDKTRSGEYIIDLPTLEEDIKYLSEHGYTAVFVNDSIRYVRYGEKLPEKPVILTFDDGSYSIKEYLPPLLEKYSMKASVSIVGEFTTQASESPEAPDPAYSYLSWADISELRDSGNFEFMNHSFSMHSIGERQGVCRKKDEGYERYRKTLYNDLFALQQELEENCGFRPNVFVYPYGFADDAARELIPTMDFDATLGVEEKPNYLVEGDNQCLYDLHRYNRPAWETTKEFMEKLLAK